MSNPRETNHRGAWAWIRNGAKILLAFIGAIGVVVGAALGVIQLGDWLMSAGEDPIHTEYHYFSAPNDAVIMRGFDPEKNFLSYSREQLALSYPSIWVDITGQAEDENVVLAPCLVVDVINVKLMPEKVNYAVYSTGGGGGDIDAFATTFAPEREGAFYAPQLTEGTAPGLSTRDTTQKTSQIDDYFTLMPGEKELFSLRISMLPGYYYRFRVGVLYSYKGEQAVDWSEQEFVAGQPLKAKVWVAPNAGTLASKAAGLREDSSHFRRYGDLEKYRNYTKGLSTDSWNPWTRPNRRELEKAIARQNAAVQGYDYPLTPPGELDTPGEG